MANEMKEKDDFEVFCYESDEGCICLDFGEAAISFSKKRFLEFADKLNEVRQTVLREYLQQQKNNQAITGNSSYRI